MLRKRLITVLTFNNGILFRTRNFKPDYRYTANFIDLWGIDEIVILDITRPDQGDRQLFYDVVRNFSENCFVPITAGGCVTSIDEIRKLLHNGADKVIINTEAINNPNFITQASQLFGSQCVIISIDARMNGNETYEVFSCFGSRHTGMHPVQWARKAQEYGAGEIMITSIDKDGSLEGYDNRLNKTVSEAVDIPVIVCGGAGKWQDFVDGFAQGNASAVCTTNIYHFTETSIKSAKRFLKSAGIDVRVD